MPPGVPKRELSVWRRATGTAAKWLMIWLYRPEADLSYLDSAYPKTAVNVTGHPSCCISFGRCTAESWPSMFTAGEPPVGGAALA